ncbi:hypothetical protein [Streptomyces sp. F001]|uniref:hypothetical protein n=1 Tax=Streptomyces sp. F001 TaxID=1510026 RepID=UPI00101E5942|nr:hypothetical protein [Streptomyces sp. F001]
MDELWSAIGALSGAGALVVTLAAWWTQHRRTLTVDREATARDARAAQGRAALVIASAPWSSSTTIDVQITNGGSTAITDVEVIDVRRHPAHPGEGWRLASTPIPTSRTACILHPRESLAVKVELIDASGEAVSQATGMGLVVVFRFMDADGQWWRREMGRPPERYEIQPAA